MSGGKTIGELMEEMRQKAGAKEYCGHTYMDLARFDENTKHMIIFDVLTHDSPVGNKGERTRLYLGEVGYQKALENQEKGNIKIISHARVAKGNLYYDLYCGIAVNGIEAPSCDLHSIKNNLLFVKHIKSPGFWLTVK